MNGITEDVATDRQTDTRTHTHTHTHTHTDTHSHTHAHAYTHTHTHTHKHTHARTHMHTHTHTRAHTHARTHTRTRTQNDSRNPLVRACRGSIILPSFFSSYRFSHSILTTFSFSTFNIINLHLSYYFSFFLIANETSPVLKSMVTLSQKICLSIWSCRGHAQRANVTGSFNINTMIPLHNVQMQPTQ